MNPRFQPLLSPPTPAESTVRPFAMKIMPAETTAVTFKPLSSVLSAVGLAGNSGEDGESESGAAKSTLDPKREGDRINRLNLTCSCGRLHEIDLQY